MVRAKKNTNYPRALMMQGMKMGLRKGSPMYRAKHYYDSLRFGKALRSGRARIPVKPSFLTRRTKIVKSRCAKQITRNLNSYKHTLMKNSGFYVYRSVLNLQNENRLTATEKVNGYGIQLYTSYKPPTESFTAIPANSIVRGTIIGMNMFAFQPQWPGEKCGAFLNDEVYGGQPVFGAIGNTNGGANTNFKSTMSPCVNAVTFGTVSECAKTFGSQVTFNKVYTFNSTISMDIHNHSNESVYFFVLDVKVREKQLLASTGLKNINFYTLFQDISQLQGVNNINHKFVLSRQLQRGILPHKLFQVVKKRKYLLGPQIIEGTAPIGPPGQRNSVCKRTVTIKYNNLKTWNRSAQGSEAAFEGLKNNILDQTWSDDIYTVCYVVPTFAVSSTTGNDVSEKVSISIRKTVAFGTK